MNAYLDWAALTLAVLIVTAYEAWLAHRSRLHPPSMSRPAHAMLRQQWVQALSGHEGSEIIAVQALRNSLMSATITASTAAIMLMGCITLAASNADMLTLVWPGGAHPDTPHVGPKLVLMLMMLVALFATYVCSAMSMRYFNHAGFVMSMPVGSAARKHYEPMSLEYVSRAGVLYGWGLRCFLFMAPLVAGLFVPVVMPIAAVILVAMLRTFDRAGPTAEGG